MTVRRSQAPLVRGSQLAVALRSSREALTDLQDQLDALLAAVRGGGSVPVRAAAERVSAATADAGAAVARLGTGNRRPI